MEIQWGKYDLKTKVILLSEKVQMTQKKALKIKWWISYNNFNFIPKQNRLPFGHMCTFESERPVSAI